MILAHRLRPLACQFCLLPKFGQLSKQFSETSFDHHERFSGPFLEERQGANLVAERLLADQRSNSTAIRAHTLAVAKSSVRQR